MHSRIDRCELTDVRTVSLSSTTLRRVFFFPGSEPLMFIKCNPNLSAFRFPTFPIISFHRRSALLCQTPSAFHPSTLEPPTPPPPHPSVSFLPHARVSECVCYSPHPPPRSLLSTLMPNMFSATSFSSPALPCSSVLCFSVPGRRPAPDPLLVLRTTLRSSLSVNSIPSSLPTLFFWHMEELQRMDS